MAIATEIQKQIIALKEKLNSHISNLPDNPKIKRLNNNCFTLNFSDLSKTSILSPEYYDFKLQYREIINLIDRTPIAKLEKILQDVIERGSIRLAKTEGGYNIFKLNPVVIEYLKGCI